MAGPVYSHRIYRWYTDKNKTCFVYFIAHENTTVIQGFLLNLTTANDNSSRTHTAAPTNV